MYYSILFALATLSCFAGATLDITFKKYGMCEDHKDTPIQYWASFKKINSTVSLGTGKAVLPFPVGDDCKLDVTIEIFRDDEWKPLYDLKDKPICQLLEKYGAELWHNTQEKLNLEKGSCPIPKGTYELKDHVIDFDLLTIKTAPKALLRSRGTLRRENELLLCVDAEYESL